MYGMNIHGLSPFTMVMSGGDHQEEGSGYQLFTNIYKTVLDELSSKANKKLTQNSLEKINRQLEEFKRVERETNDSFKRFAKKVDIYQKSRGQINLFDAENGNFEALYKKHSNLYKLEKLYNEKSIDLINLMETLLKAAVNSITNENRTGKNTYPGYTPLV